MLRGVLIAGAMVIGVAVAPVATAGSSVYYPNCRAACAAGVAPIYAGQPGYRAGLDRNGDGIACEVCH